MFSLLVSTLFLPTTYLFIVTSHMNIHSPANATGNFIFSKKKKSRSEVHQSFSLTHMHGSSEVVATSSSKDYSCQDFLAPSQQPSGVAAQGPPPLKTSVSLSTLLVDSAPLALLSIYYPCQARRPRLTVKYPLFWSTRMTENGRIEQI